jgi:hypothetical protein
MDVLDMKEIREKKKICIMRLFCLKCENCFLCLIKKRSEVKRFLLSYIPQKNDVCAEEIAG